MERQKNGILKKSRGVSFDDAVLEIAEGRLLNMLINANHPGQVIYVIRLKGYVHCVPAINAPRCYPADHHLSIQENERQI